MIQYTQPRKENEDLEDCNIVPEEKDETRSSSLNIWTNEINAFIIF